MQTVPCSMSYKLFPRLEEEKRTSKEIWTASAVCAQGWAQNKRTQDFFRDAAQAAEWNTNRRRHTPLHSNHDLHPRALASSFAQSWSLYNSDWLSQCAWCSVTTENREPDLGKSRLSPRTAGLSFRRKVNAWRACPGYRQVRKRSRGKRHSLLSKRRLLLNTVRPQALL